MLAPSTRRVILLMLAGPLACADGDLVGVGSRVEPTTIAIQSGGEVSSKAGEPVTWRVVVTDEGGAPLERVRVEWYVASGRGVFLSVPPSLRHAPAVREAVELLDVYTSLTNQFGVAPAYFIPTQLGASAVTASAFTGTGAPVGSVSFATTSDTLVIAVGEVDWDATWPAGPQGVQVDAGTPIEWVLEGDEWWGPFGRVRSVSVPPGGREFESPALDPGQRYAFAPEVAGTWEWEFNEERVHQPATLQVR